MKTVKELMALVETYADMSSLECNGENFGNPEPAHRAKIALLSALKEEVINANRYRFLSDFFAVNADDDQAEFAKLAHLTGKEFDQFIDSEMQFNHMFGDDLSRLAMLSIRKAA